MIQVFVFDYARNGKVGFIKVGEKKFQIFEVSETSAF